MKNLVLALMAVAIGALTVPAAARADCPHCGCQQHVKKICHVECIEKEVKTPKFSCKCEDFCIPGPSCLCDTKCAEECCHPYKIHIWQPGCGEVRTRKILIVEDKVERVPGWKWEVETVCCGCGLSQVDAEATKLVNEGKILPASFEMAEAPAAPPSVTVPEAKDAPAAAPTAAPWWKKLLPKKPAK